MKNYYEILNVPITASIELVKKKYRFLAKKYHPDINKGNNARYMFNEVTIAYKVLSDRKSRVQYNKRLLKVEFKSESIEPVIQENTKIKIIYSRSLGALAKRGFFLSSLPKRFREKNDIKYDIEAIVDYYYAQKGGVVEIAVPVKLPCWECSGQDHYCHICDGKGYMIRASKIKVVIPKGPRSGEIFEVDLRNIRQGNLAVIRARKLRLKIVITHKKTSYKQLEGHCYK